MYKPTRKKVAVEKTITPSISSATILKWFYTIVLIAGIILLISWYALYLIPQGIWYDPGLYAVAAILIGFGITGRLLYGTMEKAGEEQPTTRR